MTGPDRGAYYLGQAAARAHRGDQRTAAEAAAEQGDTYAARFVEGYDAQRRADSPLTRHLTPRTAHV